MQFKNEAQQVWMYKMKNNKSKSLEHKLAEALSESGHGILLESRRNRPALIQMKRGTLIPVHHARAVRSPGSGEQWVIAGIGPGRYERIHSSYLPNAWYMALKDFYALREWIPCQSLVKAGIQDETGWAMDEGERYNARRDLRIVRKFRKILTMKMDNIQTLEALPPGTDPAVYEGYPSYDDNASYWRKQRVRGDRIG